MATKWLHNYDMVMEGNGTDSNVLFLDSAKEILMLFAQEKNISRTYQLYKNIFAINQNGYSSFKVMWKELTSISHSLMIFKWPNSFMAFILW